GRGRIQLPDGAGIAGTACPARAFDGKRMITVVAYHVQVDNDGGTSEMYRRADHWGGRDYETLLSMLADSARWAMPGCRLVLCTDMRTQISPDSPWERYRRQRGDYRVGAHRMDSHAAFLANQPPGKYLFCDT